MKVKAVLAALCAAAPLAALAQSVSYDFTQTAVGAFGSGPYGTVTLTQSGANVNVSVSLASAYNFVDTGEHVVFAFDATGVAVGDISSIAFANDLGDTFRGVTSPTNAPFGSFTLGIECYDSPGNPCTNGASGGGYVDSLTFTVAGATLSDFNGRFSADLYGNGATGVVGTGGSVTAVPEPQTYALMLAGLGVVGFMGRRRNKS